jgi:hypothetical protein
MSYSVEMQITTEVEPGVAPYCLRRVNDEPEA